VKSTVLFLAAISLPFFSAISINFDAMKLGEMPADWTPVTTNQDSPPHWIVKHDPTAPSRPNARHGSNPPAARAARDVRSAMRSCSHEPAAQLTAALVRAEPATRVE